MGMPVLLDGDCCAWNTRITVCEEGVRGGKKAAEIQRECCWDAATTNSSVNDIGRVFIGVLTKSMHGTVGQVRTTTNRLQPAVDYDSYTTAEEAEPFLTTTSIIITSALAAPADRAFVTVTGKRSSAKSHVDKRYGTQIQDSIQQRFEIEICGAAWRRTMIVVDTHKLQT